MSVAFTAVVNIQKIQPSYIVKRKLCVELIDVRMSLCCVVLTRSYLTLKASLGRKERRNEGHPINYD